MFHFYSTFVRGVEWKLCTGNEMILKCFTEMSFKMKNKFSNNSFQVLNIKNLHSIFHVQNSQYKLKTFLTKSKTVTREKINYALTPKISKI